MIIGKNQPSYQKRTELVNTQKLTIGNGTTRDMSMGHIFRPPYLTDYHRTLYDNYVSFRGFLCEKPFHDTPTFYSSNSQN